jgi:hypothetical protein
MRAAGHITGRKTVRDGWSSLSYMPDISVYLCSSRDGKFLKVRNCFSSLYKCPITSPTVWRGAVQYRMNGWMDEWSHEWRYD